MPVTRVLQKVHTQPYYIRRIRLGAFTVNTPEDVPHGGPRDTYPDEVRFNVVTAPTDNSAVTLAATPGADVDNVNIEVVGAGAVAGLTADLICIWYSNADSPQDNTSLANQNY